MNSRITTLRLFTMLAVATASPVVAAAVTCEQLAEIALVTERLRDNGTPLAAVMAEADRLQATGKFTAIEVAGIRDTIEKAFKRIRTANETLLDCRDGLKR